VGSPPPAKKIKSIDDKLKDGRAYEKQKRERTFQAGRQEGHGSNMRTAKLNANYASTILAWTKISKVHVLNVCKQ